MSLRSVSVIVLEPIAVFEFGLANDATFERFERTLTGELAAAGIAYTLHWSKNSGIDPGQLDAMYGADRVGRWLAARRPSTCRSTRSWCCRCCSRPACA